MKRKLNKFIIVFLLLCVVGLNIFAKTTQAQAMSPWYSPRWPEFVQKVYDPSTPDTEVFGERYTAAQVSWIMWSIPSYLLVHLLTPDLAICLLTGFQNTTKCASTVWDAVFGGFDEWDKWFGIVDNSGDPRYAYSNNTEFIYKFFYNNPVSGVGYILKTADKFDVVPEAYAQGFGYTTGGDVVKKLWTTVRDVAYSLLILASIILAFMVMFRVKTSPQTTITVQSAIPRVVLAIILVTFSYAIAGLLIDLMYVIIGLGAGILYSSGFINQSNYPLTEFFKDLVQDRNAFILTWQYLIVWIVAAIFTIFSASFFGGILLFIMIIFVIVLVIVNCFRIMWMLIKTFTTIVLLIAAGPLFILMGIFPNSSGFFGWMKQLFANLMVYPLVCGMFFLSFFFLAQSLDWSLIWDSARAAVGLVPFQILPDWLSTTGTWSPPLTWGTQSGRFLWALSSLVIFMGIPKASDMAKGLIMGARFDYGQAIGEAIGTGTAPYRYAWGASQKGIQSVAEGEISRKWTQFQGWRSGRRARAQRQPGQAGAPPTSNP